MSLIETHLKEIRDNLVSLTKSEREIERNFEKRLLEMSNQIHSVSERLSVDIASLKATAITYGSVAGFIPGAILFMVEYLRGK